MNLDLIYSRPAKTVGRLADLALDQHRFLTKKVLLTGEPEVLKTSNGRNCFLNAIGLLVRICPNITIHVPPACDGLLAACRAFSDRIAFGSGLEYRTHL